MERLRLSSFLAYEAEDKDYDTPEQLGRRRVSFALAGEAEKEEAAGYSGAPVQAEKGGECRHECPDRHLLEEEAVEEAECPYSPEEEEEQAEASSSEG